ncbi:MAG: oxygen-independent coproporphyrinogen III oxidase [Gammaproteobacteria bacterium]|nr:oxygen-independent coproporphyrinogen III oxidase [Gammaproteobacteria bacterium]
MSSPLSIDLDLIRRYDTTGPRYTSYPTAVHFSAHFSDIDYRRCAQLSNEDPIPNPLSLYFHIPFCSTLCYYCACNKILTKVRSKAETYLRSLREEVRLQSELFHSDRKVLQLHLGGGTPTFLTIRQIDQLLSTVSAHFALADEHDRDYSIEIDPRTVEAEDIFALRALGFNRISIGIQDFEPNVQAAVHRIQSYEHTLAVIVAARRAGFRSISVDLMYGLPLQTVSSFRSTLDKVLLADPDRICVFNYAHLPERFAPQRRILDRDLPSPQEKLEILINTLECLDDAEYQYIGMDHFAKHDDDLSAAQRDGTLYRNFQGYATHANCDLLGMGVTSIGHVRDCYSQNTHNLDQYYRHIDAGRLAVSRGIELTHDDKLRAEIINQLMCYSRLNTNTVEQRHGIRFTDYFKGELQALEGMEKDGLLVIQGNQIHLTLTGRLLVRNVCMIFDRYLHHDQPKKSFSRVI